MSGLLDSALPKLPSLTPAPTSTSGSGSTSAGSKTIPWWAGLFGIEPNRQAGYSYDTEWSAQRIVFIVLGFLFVAGGIFTFKEVRQQVISTTKTAAKLAAVA